MVRQVVADGPAVRQVLEEDTEAGGQFISSDSPAEVDFAMVLTDVSAFKTSKAKRFLRSMWLFGSSQLTDVDAAVEQLCAALEREGFHASRATEQECGSGTVLLLLRASESRLQREYHREQLDAWVQSRAPGEFEPKEVADPRGNFSAARRIALLHPPLQALLPSLMRGVLRGGDLLTLGQVFPLHDRRFTCQLLLHLSRHAFMAPQMVHQLRNEYGEKVGFYFAFRSFQQRWLRFPAAVGVVLAGARAAMGEAAWAHSVPAYATPLLGLSISLWGTAMLEAWRLQQHEARRHRRVTATMPP